MSAMRCRGGWSRQGLTAIALALMSALALAVDLPPELNTSRERVPNLPLPQTAPSFDLRIQAPEKSAVPKAVEEIEFDVRGITVEGNTHFPQEDVDALFAPLVGQRTGLEALRERAAELESRYRSRGFFLTRVFIPPQQVSDGMFRVVVVEGYLSAVYIDGTPDDRLRERIETLTRPLVGQRPADLAAIERALLLINDLPGVTGTSLLRQGAELGASEMLVTIGAMENTHILSVANTGSNILGPLTVSQNSTLYNPFGRTGSLNLGLTGNGDDWLHELRALSVRYAMPVGDRGAIFSVGAVAAHAVPGGSVESLDLTNNTQSVSARLRMPLLRTRPNSLFLDVGLALNRSRTDSFDQRLSFDRSTVAEATLSWLQNGWANGSTTTNVSVFHGLPGLGSSKTGDLVTVPDFEQRFVRFTANLQRVQQTPINNVSALLLLQGQWTQDKLLSGELAAFGGPFIGRGYDPSALTGDRGFGGLLELRYDSSLNLQPWIGNVQFYAFFDRAHAQTLASANATGSGDTIESSGFGARFGVGSRGYLDLQFADAHYRTRNDGSFYGGDDRRPDPRFLFSGVFRF